MIIFPHNQLRNRYNGVPLVFKIRQHGIQGICGVFCSIMAENDSSRSKCFVVTYGVNDRIHTVIFPVQTVDGPLDWIIIECICCLNYLIVICPVWWPKRNISYPVSSFTLSCTLFNSLSFSDCEMVVIS